jgi:hypothetical protein
MQNDAAATTQPHPPSGGRSKCPNAIHLMPLTTVFRIFELKGGGKPTRLSSNPSAEAIQYVMQKLVSRNPFYLKMNMIDYVIW